MLKRSQLVYGAALAAMLSGGSAAFAQEVAPEADALFTKLDKNSDGKLTKDEIPEEQARFFERLVRLGDKDKDGALAKTEFQQSNKPEDKPNVQLGPGGGGEGARAGDPRQRFEMLDRNKDGKITLEELPEQIRERMKPLFERMGKTEITAEEFAKLPGPGGFGGERPDPKESFKLFDKNNDGKLAKDELPEPLRERLGQVFERLGKTELTQEEWVQAAKRFAQGGEPGGPRPEPGALFKQFDANGDGKLTRGEMPAPMRERMAPLFERLGKTELSQEEFARATEQFRGGPEGRPGQDPEGRRPEGGRPESTRPEGAAAPEGGRRPDQPRAEGGRPPFGNPEEMFSRLDANGDGKVTVEEAPERARPIVTQALRRAGKDANGSLTKEEFVKSLPPPPRGAEGGRGRPDGDRGPEGDRRPDDGRRADGDRAPEGRRPEGERREGDRGPETRRPESDRPADGRRPEGDRRPEARGPEGRGPDGGRRPDGPRGPVFIRKLDKNNDGRISKDELAKLADLFDELDTNHDGQLDPAELIGGPMGPLPPRDGDGPRPFDRRPDGDRPQDRRVDGDRGPEGRRLEGDRRPDGGERRPEGGGRPESTGRRDGDRPQAPRAEGADRRPEPPRGEGDEPAREHRPGAENEKPREPKDK